MTFPTAAFEDVFECIRNGLSVKQSPDAGGLPITRIETISDGTINPLKVGYAGVSAADSQKWLLKPGDILLSHINSVEHIGKCAIYNGDEGALVHGMNLLCLRPKDGVLFPRYAMWALKAPEFKASILKYVNKAVNQASISIGNLKQIEIPLPPLEEQKRIAGILDQADALRRLRARALEKLNTLGQAVFQEMFGDSDENPKGWKVGKISDLIQEASYGTSGKANTDGRGLPILRMGNITYSGAIDLSDLKHIELADKEINKYITKRGDLLFNRTNSKELVGKSAVVKFDDPMAIAGYLVRVRANSLGNTDYISAYLNSPHGKATLRGMCKNIVGMANINAKEMQNIKISLPPKALQDEFSNKIDELNKPRQKLEQALAETESLFSSLQSAAFQGRL